MSKKTEGALLPKNYEGCTPGPWYPVMNNAGFYGVHLTEDMYDYVVADIFDASPYLGGDFHVNARLIADAPALACEVEALRAATADKDATIARLRDALQTLMDTSIAVSTADASDLDAEEAFDMFHSARLKARAALAASNDKEAVQNG